MKTRNQILVFAVVASIITWMIGCSKEEDVTPLLSPTRNIVGTWKTALDVTHYIRTDLCCKSGLLEDVANENRMVTWVITAIDDNNVNIQVNHTRGVFTYAIRACGSSTGYVPDDLSPQFYKGIISSTSLIIKKGSKTIGTFSFNTNLMQGNWNDDRCMVYYCQRVYTKDSEFKLMKQESSPTSNF